jgi:hypothetical protein
MIEDVLVQVDKFYYPVDFIVLDTHPVIGTGAQIPVILGRPFLATSNAIINCRNGLVQMSFGNMTLELNIFDLCKQPREVDDDVHELNMIESFVEDTVPLSLFSNPLEACMAHSHETNVYTIQEMDAILEMMPVLENKRWRAPIEPLPENENKALPSNIKAPKLDLKPLPSELKYVYLGRDETYPVVISSHLDEE